MADFFMDSALYHIQQILLAAEWDNADHWVKLGYLPMNIDPPVVAIYCNKTIYTSYEVGNKQKRGMYYLDIEIEGQTVSMMDDITNDIQEGLTPIRIIDFSIAMPGDDGFDAEVQTLAWANNRGDITKVIVEPMQYWARLSATMMADRPF